MKHDKQVIAAFEEAFEADGVATKEKVAAACQAVFEKAAQQFGPQGLYVKGILNADMQGVSFRYKRPGIAQRVEHFIPCEVKKPKRQKDKKSKKSKVTASTDDNALPGSPEDRSGLLKSLASELDEDQFTQAGMPSLAALNALLEEGVAPFTADEREDLWD